MDRVLEIALAIIVVACTLAFGGVQPLAYSLVEVSLFLTLLLLLVQQTRAGRLQLHLPVGAWLFALWVLLELVPLPASLVTRVEPARNAGPAAAPAGPAPAWLTLSIYPHATLAAWLRLLAYLAAFVLAVHLFDSRRRKSFLVQTLIALGLFEAAYGIVQYLTGWQKIFTYTKQAYVEDASGTFINHNHFAGFLELTAPFALASIFYAFQSWSERRRTALRGEASGAAFQLVFRFFLLVIMLVAVIFSRSRGGILSAVFSIVFISLLAQLKVRRKAWALGLFVFLVLAIGYGLWIGLGPVLSRFEAVEAANYLKMEGRLSFWHDTLAMIHDYPRTGVGLGAFAVGFRHYQSAMLNFFVDHPHNDYLELASETGWIGVALLFLPILYLLARMITAFVRDNRRYRPSITLGCIGGALGLLLHSVTDFNLQIPANAIVLAIVLGIGYKTSCVEPREENLAQKRTAAPARSTSRVLSH